MSVKRVATACATAAVLFGGLGSCADQQEAIIVVGAPLWTAGACQVDPNTAVFLSFGVLDLYCLSEGARCRELAPAYYVPAVVASNAFGQQPNMTNSGIDNSELQLKDVDVVLSIPQAPQIIEALEAQNPAFVDFTTVVAGDSLPPNTQKGVIVEAISVPTAMALFDQINASIGPGAEITVVATLTFHAERTGNSVGNVGDIESRDFAFPIKVCTGCLRSCDACTNQECEGANLETLTWSGGICGNSQDGPIVPTICEI